MTFILGHDKILETPISEVARMIAFFYTSDDMKRLMHLRALLVTEQLQLVRTSGLRGERLKQALARVRGENWKLGAAMRCKSDEKEKLQVLANGFWSGMEAVNQATGAARGATPR